MCRLLAGHPGSHAYRLCELRQSVHLFRASVVPSLEWGYACFEDEISNIHQLGTGPGAEYALGTGNQERLLVCTLETGGCPLRAVRLSGSHV